MTLPVTKPQIGILLTRPQTTVSLGQMVLSNGAIRNVTIAIEMDFGLGPNIDLSTNPMAALALNQIKEKIEALMYSHQYSSRALPDLRSETDQINDNALILRNASIPPLLHTNAWSQTPAFRGYNAAANWNDLKMFIIQTVQSTISPRASPAIILPPPPAPPPLAPPPLAPPPLAPPPLAPPIHHQKAPTTIHPVVPHITDNTDLYETPPLPPPEASIPPTCRMLQTQRTSLRSPREIPIIEDRDSSRTAPRPLATTTQPQPLYRESPPSHYPLSARTAQFEDPQPQQHTHVQKHPTPSLVWQTPMTSSVAPLAQQTTPFFPQRRREEDKEDDDLVDSSPRPYPTGETPRGFPVPMKEEVPDEDEDADSFKSSDSPEDLYGALPPPPASPILPENAELLALTTTTTQSTPAVFRSPLVQSPRGRRKPTASKAPRPSAVPKILFPLPNGSALELNSA